MVFVDIEPHGHRCGETITHTTFLSNFGGTSGVIFIFYSSGTLTHNFYLWPSSDPILFLCCGRPQRRWKSGCATLCHPIRHWTRSRRAMRCWASFTTRSSSWLRTASPSPKTRWSPAPTSTSCSTIWRSSLLTWVKSLILVRFGCASITPI